MAGLHIVDLGCGFGEFARKIRQAGASYVLGIDCSEKMLAKARTLTDDPSIQYRRMNLEELDIEGNVFDVAVSSLALHYVDDYRAMMQRIARIVKKGGRFLFSVEHPICTALAAQRWICNDTGDPMFWPVDDIVRRAREAHGGSSIT